ncbi:MAG TPA: transposase [Streptosporangiaceae bacterium]|nr:transposase [Streptosporangiaceae bacterium]
MGKGSGLTRGDVRRNARKAALRALVPASNAVVGVDLGEKKQALAVTGGDNRVLARRSPRVSVHGLGEWLDWAREKAVAAGYRGVTVACEPTGSRWMAVQEMCQLRGVPLVCVQPLVSHIAREQQDLTGDKADEPDSELIARLARELHCYAPEELDAGWAELRAAGRDRAAQITRATAARQLIRDQLGLVAPALLGAHCEPLDSATWLACLETVLDGVGGGSLAGACAAGYEAFAAAASARLAAWGGRRLGPTAAKVFALLSEPAAVPRMVRAARRRLAGALEDLKYARGRRERLETEMIAMLGELGIDWQRVSEIPGLSPASLAAIVAEAGDLHRYASSSSLVKHAGMSPARNESAAFRGKTAISRRGRPNLRLAAWRATWAVLRHCDVLAAKHAALMSRQDNRLNDAQARAACAASLLRWVYSLIVHGTSWDPRIAAGELSHHAAITA